MTTRTFRLRFALAALVGAALLTGCGVFDRPEPGFPSPPSGPPEGPAVAVPIAGGATTESATLPAQTTVPASGGITLSSVSVPVPGGGTTTLDNVIIASVGTGGQSVTLWPSTPLAIIRGGQPIVVATFPQGAPVAINGQRNSGVTLNSDGSLTTDVALPVDPVNGTIYRIELPPGEFAIPSRAARQGQPPTTGKVWVNSIVFTGSWFAQGVQVVGGTSIQYRVTSPLPKKMAGEIYSPQGIVAAGFDNERPLWRKPCYLVMVYKSGGANIQLQQRQEIPNVPGLTEATLHGYPAPWLLANPYLAWFQNLLSIAFTKTSVAHGWPDNNTVAGVEVSIGTTPTGWR